jgi:hypothetical protein
MQVSRHRDSRTSAQVLQFTREGCKAAGDLGVDGMTAWFDAHADTSGPPSARDGALRGWRKVLHHARAVWYPAPTVGEHSRRAAPRGRPHPSSCIPCSSSECQRTPLKRCCSGACGTGWAA